MKITKAELKKIVREELEQVTEDRFTDGKTAEEMADFVKSGSENIIKWANQLKKIASRGEKGDWDKADQLTGTIRAIANVQLQLSIDKIKRPRAWLKE